LETLETEYAKYKCEMNQQMNECNSNTTSKTKTVKKKAIVKK